MTSLPAIEVEQLAKDFTYFDKKEELLTRRAVDDFSFTLEDGGIVGLISPNGAGKTTLIKVLTGMLWPAGLRRYASASS